MNQDNYEQVFLESFTQYSDAIFRFCMVKVSNIELAEDMTQEVFMRYWQYLREGKPMTNTRSFLYTIANNLAKDWYKKKKADSLDVKMETGPAPKDTTAGPDTVAEYQEVLTAITALDAQDAEILVLTHVEGLPPKEIAHILGESANTISVRLHRAQKQLQQQLGV